MLLLIKFTETPMNKKSVWIIFTGNLLYKIVILCKKMILSCIIIEYEILYTL